MARLVDGPLGPIRGKVGTVIGSSWMGIPYIKSRGRKRIERRGPIEGHNQNNFALLHRWLRPVLPFLKQGFKGYAPRVQGFNAAKSYALKNAFVGEPGAKVFDPAKVQVSYGDLPLPSQLSFEKENDSLRFHWDPALPKAGHPCDQAMLLIYNPEKGGKN